jgi:hypothetical protein
MTKPSTFIESTDAEYAGWGAEEKYRYWERIGMLAGYGPITGESDETARMDVRSWLMFERKRKQKESKT